MGTDGHMEAPLQLRSRQWSCSELDAGMQHMIACKVEMNDGILEGRAKHETIMHVPIALGSPGPYTGSLSKSLSTPEDLENQLALLNVERPPQRAERPAKAPSHDASGLHDLHLYHPTFFNMFFPELLLVLF